MSQPLGEDKNLKRKANWLGRYLGVEGKFDAALRLVLLDALSGVDDAFGKLGDSISGQIRRVQLSQSRRAIRSTLESVLGDTANLIRDYRQDAAMAAVDATLYDQSSLLSMALPNVLDRRNFADSLRQSGRRNVESVMARVLSSEKPLSKRVYKTEALANGQVSQAINRALVRGDSAENLAKSVRALINPDVPGGISYAARRLGRTELNNAFHAQSIWDAEQLPWIDEMEWHLSKVHSSDPGDECEEYALIRYFPVKLMPGKPHPNCRCYVTPRIPDYNQFQTSLLQGHYDSFLDKFISNG